MDSFNIISCATSSSIFLYVFNFEGSGSGGLYCGSVWKYLPVVNPCDVFLHSVLHLPNVPTSAEQEHDYCILGSTYFSNPRLPFMAINCQIQVWHPGSNDVDYFGILDTEYWSAFVCYQWRLPWDMERILDLSFQRSLACHQAFFVIWCYALVRLFITLWFFSNHELPRIWYGYITAFRIVACFKLHLLKHEDATMKMSKLSKNAFFHFFLHLFIFHLLSPHIAPVSLFFRIDSLFFRVEIWSTFNTILVGQFSNEITTRSTNVGIIEV